MLDSVLTIFTLVTIYFCLVYSFEEMNLFREKKKNVSKECLLKQKVFKY